MTLAPVPTTPAESTRIATTGVLILQVTCGILARTACPLQSHGVLEVSFSGVLADSPRLPGFLEFLRHQAPGGHTSRISCIGSFNFKGLLYSYMLADSPRFPGFLEFQCIWIYRTQTAAPHGGPAKVSVGSSSHAPVSCQCAYGGLG